MYNVVVLGITGTGKSQLCNFLFDDLNNETYKVGNELFSCTYMKDIIEAEKQGKTILNGKFNLIDSPGGDDSKGKDLENLEELIKYIQEKGCLHCILLVFNYRNKISDSVKKYLEKLSLIFTPNEFYHHIIIIFTNYPKKPNKKDKKKLQTYEDQINKFMRDFFGIKEEKVKLNSYFIDTDADESDNEKLFFNENQKATRKSIIQRMELICKNNNFPPITTFTFKKEDLDKKKAEEEEIIKKRFREYQENPDLLKKDSDRFMTNKKKFEEHVKNNKNDDVNITNKDEDLCIFGQIIIGIGIAAVSVVSAVVNFFDEVCTIF